MGRQHLRTGDATASTRRTNEPVAVVAEIVVELGKPAPQLHAGVDVHYT